MPGTLYLVATPIGNPDDMTLRALKVLKEVDLIVCEEFKEGARLLRQYDIKKPLENLNEHNEKAQTPLLLQHLREGKTIALISDCGTPLFSDPGLFLVQQAIRSRINVVPIPGASSLLAALVVAGFPFQQFVFYGLLSPKKEQRRKELEQLKYERRTAVLIDAPYRLMPLLEDIVVVLGAERELCVACDLTTPMEEIRHGTAQSHLNYFQHSERQKREFVIVIRGVER
jgi:16S rRNA (cytidine1402-2'-O)-methyltransferase